jgi:glycosyltransferase involved in cell wall biosynthesis
MITVFTSSYNYGKHLRKAIESVLAQTYSDFEYHLIDYGSTDETWDIMNDYKDDRIMRIKMGCQINKTFAMNRSIKLAKSGCWSWCPADDYWHPSLLQTKVEYSLKYPGAPFYKIADALDEIGESWRLKQFPGLNGHTSGKGMNWEGQPSEYVLHPFGGTRLALKEMGRQEIEGKWEL